MNRLNLLMLTLLACHDDWQAQRPAVYCVHTQDYEVCERTRGDCLLALRTLPSYSAPGGEPCQPLKHGWRLGVGLRESCDNCNDHPHIKLYSSKPACEAAQTILALKGYRTDDCTEW
jgi:hypothetical protein